MAYRLEITLREDVLERLDQARGHEPRASFVKRALESALSEGGATTTGSSGATRTTREAAANQTGSESRVSASSRASVKPSLSETWRR